MNNTASLKIANAARRFRELGYSIIRIEEPS